MIKIAKTCLPAILVLVCLWTSIGAWDNLNRKTGSVSYEWIDGQFVMVYDQDGEEHRPLLSTMDFMVVIGETGKSLITDVVFACERLVKNINPNIVIKAPYDDISVFEAMLVWVKYLADIFLSFVTMNVEICLFVTKFALWFTSVVPSILGFLLTGRPLFDLEHLAKVLNAAL